LLVYQLFPQRALVSCL